MSNRIVFPNHSGTYSRQAHADFPTKAPFEREISRQGFFGPATHMHHRHAPTGWSNMQGDLRPRAFDLKKWPQENTSLWEVQPLLNNQHCTVLFWTLPHTMKQLMRNADGDLLLFIHNGNGDLFSDFGQLSFTEGDYILIPRGTSWRIETKIQIQVLAIEATDNMFGLPDKGLVGQHAIFDPCAIQCAQITPEFIDQQDENNWQVLVKHQNKVTTISYPYNPLDAIGWHGDVCVLKINWRDIRPLMSHRYHLPPSAHSTFVSEHFVVCTFVPRPFESDPGALKVPFYHSNEDYDEVIFYHQGEFFSRDHIYPGMLSYHPRGVAHGPHPKAYQNSFKQTHTETNEVAVMIDTRQALQCTDIDNSLPKNVEWREYVNSWQE